MKDIVEPIRDLRNVSRMINHLEKQHDRNKIMFLLGIHTMFRISDLLKLRSRHIWNRHGGFRRYITITPQKTGHNKKIHLNKDLGKKIKKYILEYDLDFPDKPFSFKTSYDTGREQAARDIQLQMMNQTKIRPYQYRRLRVKDLLNKDLSPKEAVTLHEKKHPGKKANIRIQESIKDDLQKYRQAYSIEYNDFLLFNTQKPWKPISSRHAYRILDDAARELNLSENIGTHTMRKTGAYHLLKKTKDINLVKQVLGHSSETQTKNYLLINQEQQDKALQRLTFK